MNSGKTNRVIFFGTEEFSATSLQQLIDSGFNVAAVVTKPDNKKGRGHKLIPPTVKTIALNHGIAVWQPNKLADITEDIKSLQPVTGVLVSFGKIIPQAIIDLFTPGIINVHPSKLPKYRGPSPIESAILNGDTKTGVSIMQLTAGMDAGPVYYTEPYVLDGSETQPKLYKTLAEIGAKTLVDILPKIINGSLLPTPQNDSEASYCKMIDKSSGIIDWSKSAKQIEREIRAYKAWPGSKSSIGKIDAIITEATVLQSAQELPLGQIDIKKEESTKTMVIGTASGALRVDTIKPIGKKEMPIRAFLDGYGDKL